MRLKTAVRGGLLVGPFLWLFVMAVLHPREVFIAVGLALGLTVVLALVWDFVIWLSTD